MEYQAVTFEDELVLSPISPYQYVPLHQQKNEFRLVELQSFNDTLVARLRHYSFQDPPPYLALSYHKGDPRSFVIMLLDGIEVPISPNLEKALRELWPSKYHLIWADSLCIDQQDENEKAAQILRIRVIYREAQLVAAWLGIERDGSDQVMRLLGSILSVQSGRGNSVSTLIKTNDKKFYGASAQDVLLSFVLDQTLDHPRCRRRLSCQHLLRSLHGRLGESRSPGGGFEGQVVV